ncbi:orotate phosphoribosyltransferase [Paenibacillus sp. FSL A5-0031]|uniref:DUF4870 domain-containing protein n=1 Tax=Paenibacillus sp. FSL A5-0031 TaxID=1920420 RepID=UPI00096CCEF1|nr:DUF4870 domain-containing protein [Paenibacillus sp. FSL A5-0031]OME71549.1 orotate phosphoribosyltransferase [Paenibacillus sp. FSL A5-0031]
MNQSFGLHKEEKTYGMLCHLLAFSGVVIPLGNILGPLIIWLLKKDQSSYVDMHGKESLNFQISNMIYSIISGLLIFVLIGFITTPLLFIFWIAFTIIGSMRASEGNGYRYPLTIRFFK